MDNSSGPQANAEQVRPNPIDGTYAERGGAFGDFMYDVGSQVVGGVGTVGIVAGAAAVWNNVTGGNDAPSGKHESGE